MLYKKFKDLDLSCLGMGAMRLPKIEGQGEKIDEAKTQEIINYAIANGVNYFDTAYRYHAGESELVLGKILSRYPREKYYLATKMPGHMMEYNNGQYQFTGFLANFPSRSPEEIFEEQLEKCRTDYFDFYLLHCVSESSWDFYTNEEIGCVAYLLEQKKKGRIKYFGFSAHCRPDTLEKFIIWSEQQFGECFDFVQIQLNYLDWVLQEADKKYEIVTNHGLPIITMESVRGGRLVHLPLESEALLKKERPKDSIVSWAFRFLQSLPNVQVVLSGMSSMEQLKENIATFSKNDPLTADERELLQQVIQPMLNLVPCTSCRYCTESCPQNLDIPNLIAMYNEAANNKTDNFVWLQLGFTLKGMSEAEKPASCIGCGKCTKMCPQDIDIPDIMQKFAALLEERKI